MVAILGPPPLHFLKRSELSLRYWDEDGKLLSHNLYKVNKGNMLIQLGNWRGLVPILRIDLEQIEQRLDGEDRKRYLQLIQKMLRWIPEERPTASEVIYDPWLMEGFFDSSG